MLRALGALFLILVLCIGAGLAYTNSGYVGFDYLFGTVQVRLVVLVLLAFVIGALLGLVFCAVRHFGLRAELRRLRRRARELETELKNLRSLPLRDA